MRCFSVDWDPLTGVFNPEVHMPKDAGEMRVLSIAAARLITAISFTTARHTDVPCHAGCTFAAIMEMAHKEFQREDKDEYMRVVESGLMPRSPIVDGGH